MNQLITGVTLMAASGLVGMCQSGTAAASAQVAQVAQVKIVYLLPMSHGMDQYLANRLTRGGVVQVSTDPLKADALLTDHLGSAFESSVKELYPEVKPVAAAVKPEGDRKGAKEMDAKVKDAKAPSEEAKPEASEMKSAGAERPAGTGRNRGMVFLVRRGTGEVLWSAYHEPSIRRPKELDRAAGKIALGLKKAIAPASQTAPGGR